MEWELLGKRVRLYGVAMPGGDVDYVKLGRDVWAAECDPNDGYRSYLNGIKRVVAPEGVTFFQTPLATVTVRKWVDGYGYGERDGFELVDSSGHVWLTIGTSDVDDYYPSYTFYWQPKPTT